MSRYQSHIDSYKDVEVTDHSAKPNIMVVWEWIGEGYEGDYNEDDPDDAPLLRFSVLTREQHPTEGDVGDWEPAEDASYCTENVIDTPEADLKDMGLEILREFASGKGMDRMSWITPTRDWLA